MTTNCAIKAGFTFGTFLLLGGLTFAASNEQVQIGSIIDLPVGTKLSPDPGSLANRLVGGTPCLCIGSGYNGQSRFLRYICADGSFGWSNLSVTPVQELRISVPATPEQVLASSPDSGGFTKDRAVLEDLSQPGIEGSSKKAWPYRVSQLSLPEEWSPYNLPWLKISTPGGKGWIHPYSLRIETDAEQNKVQHGLPDDTLLRGTIRPPFIALAGTLADSLKPRKGVRFAFFKSIRGSPVDSTFGPEACRDADLYLRYPRSSGRLQGILGYPCAAGRIFAALPDSGPVMYFKVTGYQQIITRSLTADLDRDGNPDYVLEAVQQFGDGSITQLWVIDGRHGPSILLTGIPVEESSGENGSENVQGDWWMDSTESLSPLLWVTERHRAATRFLPLHYSKGALGMAPVQGAAFAAILMETGSLVAGQQEQVRLSGKIPSGISLFRYRSGKSEKVFVGKVFRTEKACRAWMAGLRKKGFRPKIRKLEAGSSVP